MAIRDSIIGNDLVVSPGDNVTIRISANPIRASQNTQEESKGELMINFVINEQRKAFETLWPKKANRLEAMFHLHCFVALCTVGGQWASKGVDKVS